MDMPNIGTDTLKLAEFSFEQMLKEAVSGVRMSMQRRRQAFSLSIDGRIPHILIGDSRMLTRIVAYMLRNAVSFTPKGGGIRLNTALEVEWEDGSCAVAIEVRDTGAGTPQERQKRLFAIAEQEETVGLKRILDMVSGSVTAVSEPNGGSVLRFDFTAAVGANAAEQKMAAEG